MTSNADFKRRVRERMARTGESYTAARAQLLKRTTLHVTNGDATVPGIKGTGLPGRILPWRDALHEGPVPAAPDEERRQIRAGFLGVKAAAFAEPDRVLDGHEGRFVLWFEADLYDQLQLAEILGRLAHKRDADVTLISVGEHLGSAHFGGLGELDSGQLTTLAEQAATPLSHDAIDLGARAWRALSAPDPRGIAAMIQARSSELRFMADAFDRLAREYPSTRDGLSLTERRLLAGAPGTRVELFQRAWRKEPRPFLGDSFAFAILDRLRPLITPDGVLTPDGERVLAGEADFVELHGIDRWIGGMHLHGREVPWRWDDGTERLIGEHSKPVEQI